MKRIGRDDQFSYSHLDEQSIVSNRDRKVYITEKL